MRSFFAKLKRGLTKTHQQLTAQLQDVLGDSAVLDDELFEEIETVLIAGDCGIEVATELAARVRERCKRENVRKSPEVLSRIKEEMAAILSDPPGERTAGAGSDKAAGVASQLHIIVFVGVNGVGKTTSIGKIGAHYAAQGGKVIFAAADTFRAAAGDQLEIWSERANAQIVRSAPGGDPAAVAFDAVKAAQARGIGHVLIDTAGRLHSKSNLMDELSKIRRSVDKALAGAPAEVEVLLVMDATTGQNGLAQAMEFTKAVGVTGLVLTKLDGTAKGGIVLAIAHQLKIPVRWIGVGERIDDLETFDAGEFVAALFD
ncbi:MAG: signal recognition particle-docking protein FtsY [Candidatus Zixiibacteriota bacterium]